jgi:hypothetical protein
MTLKVALAVMHCLKTQPQKVIDLAIKLLAYLYVNILEYATPPISKVNFEKQKNAASDAQGKVKDGSVTDTSKRDDEVETLHDMMKLQILPYVNGLYRGDRSNLLLSGYDVADESMPHPVPDAPIIKSIVRGKLPHSAKINLEKTKNPLGKKREKLTYFVLRADADGPDENFKLVLTTTSMFKLVVTHLTPDKLNVFKVYVSNATGSSENCGSVKFYAV